MNFIELIRYIIQYTFKNTAITADEKDLRIGILKDSAKEEIFNNYEFYLEDKIKLKTTM